LRPRNDREGRNPTEKRPATPTAQKKKGVDEGDASLDKGTLPFSNAPF